MAAVNQVGNALTGSTGSGLFVGATGPSLLLPSANNFLSGFTTTATAAGTTVLTVNSNQIQEFTGSTTQTVTLPVTSTLVAGFAFKIINNSSGAVTVNSSGGNPVQVMAANTTLYLTCVLNSGTTAASWNGTYITDYIQDLGNYSFSDNIMTVASDTMQFNLPDSTLLLNGSDDTQIAVASTSATGQPLISFYRDISTQIGAVKAGTNSTGDASGDGMFYFNGTSEGPHYFSSETTGTFFTLDPVAGSTLSAGDLTIAGQLFVGNSGGGGDLTITAGELRVGQASGGGSQTIEIFAPTAGMGVFQFISFDNAGNFFGRLQNTLLSASRTWTLPDASGTIALTSGASGIVNSGTQNQLAWYAATGTTVSGLSTTNSASLVTDGSGVPAWQALSAGQILIGTTAGAPAASAINSGTGIIVANGSGSITVSATGGGVAWVSVSGTTQAAAVNTGYIVANASQTTITLPATAAIGDTIKVRGLGAAGWILAANTGQTIKYITATTSSGGSLTSAEQYDNIEVTCIVANTTWTVAYATTTGLTVA